MILTPSHKWFVSHKKQLVTLRVSLPKVPIHLVDLQVEPTHISLHTFRFSRKYQLYVKLPETCRVDPTRASAVSADKNYLLVKIPFAKDEDSPQRAAVGQLVDQVVDKEEKKLEIEDQTGKKKECTPFHMERMPTFRSLYASFCRILKKDIPIVQKRKRILLSVRCRFFQYLRGDLSLSELKQILKRARIRKNRQTTVGLGSQPCNNNNNNNNSNNNNNNNIDERRHIAQVPEPRSAKEMLLKVAEQVDSKAESLQQMKSERERQNALLFQDRQQKKEILRERRRMKRKFAKKLVRQRIRKPLEEQNWNSQVKKRVHFSVET